MTMPDSDKAAVLFAMGSGKAKRPRWCPKCRALSPWQKVRLLGARASYRACVVCGARTRPRMPGTKKRVLAPDSWKGLMKQCDDIARRRAHARGTCENCGAPPGKARVEWAHGFSRRYHAIRHADANGRLLCYKCHSWFSDRAEEWREWLLAKLGAEVFEQLRLHRNDECGKEQLQRALSILQAGEPLSILA